MVALLLGPVSSPASGATEGPASRLAGRVVTAAGDGSAPVSGVAVQLSSPSWTAPRRTTTDSRGRWSFDDLEPGAYALSVELPGFEPFAREIRLLEGEERELHVELKAAFAQAVTVTATRIRRATEEVAAAISVVGSEAVQATPMTNLAQALAGTPSVLIESKNQGYDARLIIRGSGLKARYAIREIMVLLDGIPITDPDSLTRLDFVDTATGRTSSSGTGSPCAPTTTRTKPTPN